jgi:hypothetical protein
VMYTTPNSTASDIDLFMDRAILGTCVYGDWRGQINQRGWSYPGSGGGGGVDVSPAFRAQLPRELEGALSQQS